MDKVLKLAITCSICALISPTMNLLPRYELSSGQIVERLEPGQSFRHSTRGYWWYKFPLAALASGGSIMGLFLLPAIKRQWEEEERERTIQLQARYKVLPEIAEAEEEVKALVSAEQRAVEAGGMVETAEPEAQNHTAVGESSSSESDQNQSQQSVATEARPNPATDESSHLADIFKLVFNNKKKHLLIPAETGAGKTSLLLGLVDYYQKVSPQSEFYFSTAKPGPFLGYENKTADDGKKHVILLNMNKSYTVEPLVSRLQWIIDRMVQRQTQRTKAEQTGKPYNPEPLIIVLDEWLATLSLAKTHTKEMIREWQSAPAQERGDKPIDYEAKLIEIANNIAIMGREDNVGIWLFGQDHQVQNAGINTGLQKNFGVVVPFSRGAEQAIEHALIGRSPVPTHAQGKEIYKTAMARLEAEPKAFLAYSNIHGHQILKMPWLPDIKRKRLFEDANLTTSSDSKPKQVIQLRMAGTELTQAICQVYGCQAKTPEFERARLEVLHTIS
ncbi:hypothetical protein Lepto7375DRAFT_1793 [Leptolyngbya sp. PCC 7375]|nr:hypothetical protein Lepto7375DRAFT_1793 [Leptolyngbya sp. PCC 7375]